MEKGKNKVDVFLVASKGIPARYGGFETFADRLVSGKKSQAIQYHVSCMDSEEKQFTYQGADCFGVKLPLPGAAGRILHVSRVLSRVETFARNHSGNKIVVCILGCRIGPLMKHHAKRLRRLGVTICVNPDGLEWKRAKWKGPLGKFLLFCEKCLVINSDLAICDSRNIESYIRKTYASRVKETTFIAYGAEVRTSKASEQEFQDFCAEHQISKEGYFLIVGRFVPDNNYETMLREFMSSDTKKDLVIISNVENNKFYKRLRTTTGFEQDPRIKFVGTVYEQELLMKIRENAFAYLHGHEVGGTNPSLLEALGSTGCNLLLDVGFNREVAKDGALYWSKEEGSLRDLIYQVEKMDEASVDRMSEIAKNRIREEYNWDNIISRYEEIFLR